MKLTVAVWRGATAFLLAASSSAAAQEFKDSRTAPITIQLDGQTFGVGAPMTIHVQTVAQNTTKPVTITVAWLRSLASGAGGGPGPAARRLTAPYRPDGSYSVENVPEREGRYRAVAVSPDGTGSDSLEFSVSDPGNWLAAQADVLKTALDVASDEVDEIIRVVQAQPDSPAQRDAMRELPPLKAALSNHAAAVEQFRTALTAYGQIAASDAKFAAASRPSYAQMEAWRIQAVRATAQLEQTLAESRKANVVCDQLIIVEEGFQLANTIFTLTGGFTRLLAALQNEAPYVGKVAELSLKAKAANFAGNKIVDGIPGLAAKAARYLTSAVFDQYCQKFEGPINGNMRVEYYKDGELWWKSTVQIEGQMTLAYRKGGDARQPVALKGHIVGTGTKFTVWEEALRVLKRKLLQGGIVAGRTVAPAGTPYTSLPGAMALQASPTAFFVAVDGELKGNTLKVTVGPARTDFNETYTRARGGYVVGSPLSMNVVYFTTFEVQYDNAHGLIEKATDSDLGPLVIPVEIGKDRMTAQRTFKGARGKVKAKGLYEFTVKVCNPGC